MSIKYVILGFLSEMPLSGYDLKKKIASSDVFYWSGSSNQIYRSLVELHNEEWVTVDVQPQDGKPPRKVYTITDAGRGELHRWLQSTPALPQFQNELVMHLVWADQLEMSALRSMLQAYEEELRVRVVMIREQASREAAQRQPRPYAAIAMAHFISLYELELDWVNSLLRDIGES